ncbi:MAG: alpha-L-fucosidase [Kiritimatiellae bacterium]|nr:alpha-L-fucosidase [Kiritimatiellia bacterium]
MKLMLKGIGMSAAALFTLALPSFAETEAETAARIKWFTDARFGMFVHFGAYSLAASHEWVKNYENLSDAEYDRYVENFDPDLFNAREWVQAAKDAGMKYIVLTTKHHDGFCLFDSKLTDYKSTKTQFGRDIVKEFADACHEAGIRCGFYYSLLDWHHPDYTKDYWYPGCKGKSKEELAELNKGRDFSKYVDYLHGQVRELLTDYGTVDILWYDFTTKTPNAPWWDTFKHTEDWKGVELMALTRKLQPGIVVNDRLGNGVPADVVTPEQQKSWVWPTHGGKKAPAWESCHTFSGSWGYSRDETTWKDVRQLLTMIVDNVSKGGNTILNVGPTGRGTFDSRAKDRLAGIGRWMKLNGRSIYGCGPAPEGIVAPEGTLLTYNKEKNRLYVHLIDYPIASLPIGFSDKVRYAQFLHDASEIKIKVPLTVAGTPRTDVDPSLLLPVVKPDVEIPVVELFLK